MRAKLPNTPMIIFLKFCRRLSFIKRYRNMGKTSITEVYLARKATISRGNTRYRHLESFLTPRTSKYIVHMENATPGISIAPETAQVNIRGNDKKIKDPEKLWISLNRCLNSK